MKGSEASRTEAREETRVHVVKELVPLHPDQAEDRGERTGREEQRSSTCVQCLGVTSEDDQERPGNHGSSVPADLVVDTVVTC